MGSEGKNSAVARSGCGSKLEDTALACELGLNRVSPQPDVLSLVNSPQVDQGRPMWFCKQIAIKPYQVGYLYVKNRFRRRLEPGVYYFWDWANEITVAYLLAQSQLCTVTNQEVLTKDAIALRFSYLIEYAVVDGERFLAHFDAF